MYCNKCRKQLQSHWLFCAHCGFNIPEDDKVFVQTTLKQCSNSDNTGSHTSQQVGASTSNSTTCNDNIDWGPAAGYMFDFEDHDYGSDVVHNAILVSNEEELKEYEKVMKVNGFDEFIDKITKENNKWKDVEINIAIAGESGTGKSTLINALRNLKADEDGAAKIGCTETTKEPTPYPYRDNGNVKIWDLPGVGTPNFPKEIYIDKIKIERYDFILLVSCTRYKENDTWLANQIKSRHPNGNLFFVRTKVDDDLETFAQGHRQTLVPEKRNTQLKTIRDDCIDNLSKAGIDGTEMFLINSNAPYELDFGKLSKRLIDNVTGLKRDAMVMLLSAVTNEVVDEKIHILNKNLAAVSLVAALTANFAKIEKNGLDMLMREGKRYQQQLGIDTQSIEVLERVLKKDGIYQRLNMRSHDILKTPENFAAFCDNYTKYSPYVHSQCAMLLKCLLNMCAADTHKLHSNLTIWLDESNI